MMETSDKRHHTTHVMLIQRYQVSLLVETGDRTACRMQQSFSNPQTKQINKQKMAYLNTRDASAWDVFLGLLCITVWRYLIQEHTSS